jgi:RHH-type transcriptional regulator, rel operon repressor / antitoxin RelB
MPAEKLLNVRLPAELHGKLEQLTKATGRTKSFLTVEALKGYIEAEAWQVQDIEAGMAEADRGEFASAEEVTAFFAKHGC